MPDLRKKKKTFCSINETLLVNKNIKMKGLALGWEGFSIFYMITIFISIRTCTSIPITWLNSVCCNEDDHFRGI